MSIPNPIVLLDARASYVHPAFQMSRASTKTVFDSAGRLVTVPANALGWNHDPATGQARGYLAEPSATNLLLHSNGLDESDWSTVNASITPDAITGPDGKGMAKLVEDATNAGRYTVQSASVSAESTIVQSCVVRAGERQSLMLRTTGPSASSDNYRATFDLSTGMYSNENQLGLGQFISAGSLYLGGGFYRVWIAGTLGSLTDIRFEYRMLGPEGSTYQGDGTSGLYLGYCQAEVGSYPTSYIETGGSTATRALDGLILDIGGERWWRGDRGTFLIDIDMRQGAMVGDVISFRDDLRVEMTGTGNERGCRGGGSLSGEGLWNILPSSTPRARHRIAISWDDQEIANAVDGAITNVVASSGNGIDPIRNFGIGVRPNVSGAPGGGALSGPVERVVYYPQRLSNADLQSLTAIQE